MAEIAVAESAESAERAEKVRPVSCSIKDGDFLYSIVGEMVEAGELPAGSRAEIVEQLARAVGTNLKPGQQLDFEVLDGELVPGSASLEMPDSPNLQELNYPQEGGVPSTFGKTVIDEKTVLAAVNDLFCDLSEKGELVNRAVWPSTMMGIFAQENAGIFRPDTVSSSGALGITQMLPGTAKDIFQKYNNLGELSNWTEASQKSIRALDRLDYLKIKMRNGKETIEFGDRLLKAPTNSGLKVHEHVMKVSIELSTRYYLQVQKYFEEKGNKFLNDDTLFAMTYNAGWGRLGEAINALDIEVSGKVESGDITLGQAILDLNDGEKKSEEQGLGKHRLPWLKDVVKYAEGALGYSDHYQVEPNSCVGD